MLMLVQRRSLFLPAIITESFVEAHDLSYRSIRRTLHILVEEEGIDLLAEHENTMLYYSYEDMGRKNFVMVRNDCFFVSLLKER